MTHIADLLLVAGALAAGFYCFVLSRRLTAFKDAENGIGQAVKSLSLQVDELGKSVVSAQRAADFSNGSLSDLTKRGEDVAQRLELMVASMHDIPAVAENPPKKPTVGSPVFSSRIARTVGM